MATKKKDKDKPKVAVASYLKDAVTARLDDEEGLKAFPALMECLLPQYDDGALVRQAGKLTVRVEGAHWLVQLDCPTEKVTGRIHCSSLAEVLGQMDKAIADGREIFTPQYERNKKLPTIDPVIQ